MTDVAGRAPFLDTDSTRNWVEAKGRVDGKISPSLFLRIATDINYIRNRKAYLYGQSTEVYQTKAMMNSGLPGQKIPGITSWNVTESLDTVTQSASFEAINALPVSKVSTILTSSLTGEHHSLTLVGTYAENGLGQVVFHSGNTRPREEGPVVKYRVFQHQTFTVSSVTGFPNPGIPNDIDGSELADDSYYGPPVSGGAGAYYVQIGNEVIRVIKLSGTTFTVPPGGRAVNGVLEPHSPGEIVRLLGFGPTTGEWTAMGYLNVDDYKPQEALLRPGTCLVSYEGYGAIPSSLSHDYNPTSNYTFTGYWFVRGVEPSLGEDGVPRIRVDLANAGQILDGQKITPDLMRRAKTRYGQWKIGGEGIFGAADHRKDIPGDWVDYHNWDPSLRGSYPLQIQTELAQHKAFFDHMLDTEKGLRCIDCRRERKEWLRTHENPDDLRRQYELMPSGPAKEKVGKRIADLELQLARQIGRHIYRQSIRIIDAEAGPLKTYVRLLAVLAIGAWEHPAYGNNLAQRFTKVPQTLFNNLRNIHTGLCYNGQIDFELATEDPSYDFFTPAFDDRTINSKRNPLTAPFSTTYDKATFSQPALDLAAVNDAQFTLNRQGYPIFVPKHFSLRPSGLGYKDLARTVPYPHENNEWYASYGASIQGYSHSINSDAVITQCWVTAESAFEGSSITVVAAGTGWDAFGNRVNYGGFGGNKEGLALTSGVQQADTWSMDNQVLGLDWDTNAAGYGINVELGDGTRVINALPPLYDGHHTLTKSTRGYTRAIKRVQKTLNFFMGRRYLPDTVANGGKVYRYPINEDGRYGDVTFETVKNLQQFLRNPVNLAEADRPTSLASMPADGQYGRNTYLWTKKYLSISKHYLKFDIWWYVTNDRTWNEYLATITGIPVPYKTSKGKKSTKTKRSAFNPEESNWVIYDAGMQENVEKWLKTFSQQAINAGNRVVNDSINRATARTIQSGIADPRIHIGDTIWCEIPGFLGSRDAKGQRRPPFTNGIYVQSITRSMTLEGPNPTYTASYSGYRARGSFGADEVPSIDKKWAVING